MHIHSIIKMYKFLILVLSFSSIVLAQRRSQQQQFRQQAQSQQYTQATTPVPILRQVNTHNDDGSYTYGYEGADGTYKVETKAANGEVKGKYGYYDDTGALREIEYGATRNGFIPSGTDVNPPVIPVQNTNYNSVDYDDDGIYRPEIHERPYDYNRQENLQSPAANLISQPFRGGQQQPRRFQQRPQPQALQGRRAPPQQQSQFQFENNFNQFNSNNNNNDGQYYEQSQSQAPQYQQQQQQPYFAASTYQQPQRLHPAVPRFDIGTGSYSINY